MKKRNPDFKHVTFAALTVLVFALVCVLCVFSAKSVAYADASVKVELQEKTVHRGQTFYLDVDVTENSGLIAMKISVDYDSTAMTLINVERLDGLSQMTMTTYNTETEAGYAVRPFNMLFDSTATVTETGKIARLYFETNIDAPIGDYSVTLSYDPLNTNSSYQVPVELDLTDGTLHLISGEFAARYVDWDGTELYYRDYNEGEVPAYVGQNPSREEDDCYTYSFAGFKGDVTDETDVLQYRASYIATPKTYSVFYYVDGLTDEPDGQFTVEDFYTATQFDYGESVDVTANPSRQNYTFVGWFLDEGFTQPVAAFNMPSHDTRIYGYMRYNVRTADIPKIRLSYNELSDTEIEVLVNLTYNPGINGMVLTLDYDRETVVFKRFTRGTALASMQFETTNTAGGLNQPNFKFYWNSAANATDTGLILSMVFDVSACETGIYPVTFTYDKHHDATYLNAASEIWYTELDIKGTALAVGERYHWDEPVGEVVIEVTSDDGKPLDVELVVKQIEVDVDETSLEKLKTQNLEIKSSYSINLVRGGEIVTSETDLKIGIGLTQEELESEHLGLYYVDDNGKLVKYDFTIEDDAAQFRMRNIERWVLVGDAPAPVVEKGWTPAMVRTVLFPSLLSVATIAYALILLGKKKRKNQ